MLSLKEENFLRNDLYRLHYCEMLGEPFLGDGMIPLVPLRRVYSKVAIFVSVDVDEVRFECLTLVDQIESLIMKQLR